MSERYSVPFFYETNIDTVIEPLVEDCQEVRDYIAKNFDGKKSICAAGMVIAKLLSIRLFMSQGMGKKLGEVFFKTPASIRTCENGIERKVK